MKKIFLIAFIAPLTVFAQNNLSDSAFIKRISDNILLSRASYNNLHTLTKTIGGRLAGSPQMVKAEQWGAQALRNAGADDVTLQECIVPHWVRGGKDKASVTYKNANGKTETMQLNVLALGNSVGSGAKGVQASLVRVNSFDELEQKKDEVKGKINGGGAMITVKGNGSIHLAFK